MVIYYEKNNENIIYGESLREIRKKNNLTQDKVAQLTGLETKYISQIECGIAKGGISTMLKFCEAYNVTPNDILHQFISVSKPKNEIEKLSEDFSKLNKRDKEIILSLIELLLEN